ncbi:MAG: alanine dehydrogenase, partial [Bacteroidales bacterium]|nr:alanine dehydrogenase [Bacteroidales bacterium]
SALHLTIQKSEFFKEMMKKKVTALGFEYIKDVTKTFPVIRLMSEIAGTASIYVAADYLCDPAYGKGMMLGGFSGITPAEVVIIGAGTVSEYAARAALGMGASVKVFDNSIYKLRRLQQNLKTSIYTSILHPKTLRKAIREADVAIGAIHSGEGRTSCIVTEDMVKEMKAGAVIVDVSIDQGGCFETSRVTSHDDPVYKKYDVTHYCVPNIASRVPNTGSYALSNFFVPMLLKIGEEGGMTNMVKMDYGMRHGIYLFNGILAKKHISEYYTLPFQDIELLMAAFQ